MKWENAVLRWRHASISPSVGIGENFFSEGAVSGQRSQDVLESAPSPDVLRNCGTDGWWGRAGSWTP